MQRPGHSRVILDLALDEEPIRGWVQTGHEPERAFAGWLSLSAALDRARRRGELDGSEGAPAFEDPARAPSFEDPAGAPAVEDDTGPLAAGE